MKSALLACIFACASTAALGESGTLETLYGVEISEEGVAFKVESGGCVGKEHFELIQLETYPSILELRRIGYDPCEAVLPYGQWVRYSYADLRLPPGSPLSIGNPVAKMPAR